MAQFWKLSPQEQADTVSGMKFMTLDANKTFFGTSANPGPLYETTKAAAELWLEAGVIKKAVDAKPLIAFDIMNAATTAH